MSTVTVRLVGARGMTTQIRIVQLFRLVASSGAIFGFKITFLERQSL